MRNPKPGRKISNFNELFITSHKLRENFTELDQRHFGLKQAKIQDFED
jgi:hypothetical protein